MLEYVRSRKTFRNREGLEEYDFQLHRSRSEPGVSAMVRVRDEEPKIEHALRSILPVFDEIVVTDNGSTDRTAALVRSVAERFDDRGVIRVHSYPHTLGRFGPEHGATPEDSVHSAVYFTNWSLSHCTRKYVCKWDGDMVLRREVRPAFRELLDDIQRGTRKCWVLAGQTVYRDLDGGFWLSRGEVNREIELFPNGLPFRFVKDPRWERFRRPFYLPKDEFDPVCFYELKYADQAEFDHWSTTDWPTARKRREWMNFHRVREGRFDASFRRLAPGFLDDQVASGTSRPTNGTEPRATIPVAAGRLPLPRKPAGQVPASKRRLRRAKKALGYYRLRNRLREPAFRRHLRPTDAFIIGHPKSGNTWLAYMLALLIRGDEREEIDLYNVGDYVPFVHGSDAAVSRYDHLPDPRVFRNEFPEHRRLYPRIIYVVRDPRSVLVSFWDMYGVIFDDRTVPLASFVEQYLAGTGIFTYWNRPLVRWDRQVRQALDDVEEGRNTHIVRYEDLVASRGATLESVAQFLGLDCRGHEFERAVERGSFEAMRSVEDRGGAEAYTGRAWGSGRFIRKGEVDGWKREMAPDLSWLLEEEFGSVMARVGYR